MGFWLCQASFPMPAFLRGLVIGQTYQSGLLKVTRFLLG